MKMAKTAVLGSHTSSNRDSWWYLVQDDDGTLHVEYENDDDPSDNHRVPINDFLKSQGGSGARKELMDRIGRMFEDRDTKAT
jgi:hypothetical protein